MQVEEQNDYRMLELDNYLAVWTNSQNLDFETSTTWSSLCSLYQSCTGRIRLLQNV